MGTERTSEAPLSDEELVVVMMFSGDTADCDRAPIELEAGLEVSLALRQRDQDPESVLPFVRIRLEETRQLDALVTVNDWMRSLTFFVGTVISSEGVSFDPDSEVFGGVLADRATKIVESGPSSEATRRLLDAALILRS